MSHITAVPALPKFPAARDCDPRELGWMQGSPPPADKRIAFQDTTSYRFPQLRWSFAHQRQLVPTVVVTQGHARPLPASATELPNIQYTALGGQVGGDWTHMMEATYTDALLVIHKGQVLFEHYNGVMTPATQHVAMSVSKSFMGMMAACLVADGQ